VLVALPLSILAVVVSGLFLPHLSLFILIVIACVIMPTDFAPAATLLRSPRIPARVRQILNIESGYNDGLVSPVFGMALAAAIAWPTILAAVNSDNLSPENQSQLEERLGEFFEAFFGAVPATAIAILVG
jgi:NhaP-type Na+/H+ or K+/H+ antiporter